MKSIVFCRSDDFAYWVCDSAATNPNPSVWVVMFNSVQCTHRHVLTGLNRLETHKGDLHGENGPKAVHLYPQHSTEGEKKRNFNKTSEAKAKSCAGKQC